MSGKFDLSRRGFLAMSGAGLVLPKQMFASPTESEKLFIFVFCPGGWDPTYLFTPQFDTAFVDTEDDAFSSTVNGITFVDHSERPIVRTFVEDHGQDMVFINGFEVRSVAHDASLRIMMTGTSIPATNDWCATIAKHSESDLMLPMIHVSGPGYTHSYGGSVVRVGAAGQLSGLMNGTVMEETEGYTLQVPSSSVDDLEDVFVKARVEAYQQNALRGWAENIGSKELSAQKRLLRLKEITDQLDLGGGTTLKDQMGLVVDCLELGLSRTGMVSYDGYMGLGWDTHSANFLQGPSLEEVFDSVSWLIDELKSRTDQNGVNLYERTTIVGLSEMGRFPLLNGRDGKEHWTYTSCFMIGAGIQGGQVIGGYNDRLVGLPTNLESGLPVDGGEPLKAGHVGATLLALAGIDNSENASELPPITAVLS